MFDLLIEFGDGQMDLMVPEVTPDEISDFLEEYTNAIGFVIMRNDYLV
jgi:hypothetical protein